MPINYIITRYSLDSSLSNFYNILTHNNMANLFLSHMSISIVSNCENNTILEHFKDNSCN